MDEALDGWDFRLIYALVERLPLEPNSLWAALKKGGREYFGWGPLEYISANIVDSVGINTAVTQVAGTRRKPKIPEPSYRPGKDKSKVREIRPKSVREMKNIQLRG